MGMAGELLLAGAGLAANEIGSRRFAAASTCRIAVATTGSAAMKVSRGFATRLHRDAAVAGQAGEEGLQILDAGGESAADAVLQSEPRIPPPGIEESLEPRAEHAVEAAPRRRGQAMQEQPGLRIGPQDQTGRIESHETRTQGMQIFRAVMEGHDDIAVMVFAEQPILDLRRRHCH